MVFEYIIRYSPRRRASHSIAEGFSPTASPAYRMHCSKTIASPQPRSFPPTAGHPDNRVSPSPYTPLAAAWREKRRRRRSELLTTNTELKAMAPAARIGLSCQPVKG